MTDQPIPGHDVIISQIQVDIPSDIAFGEPHLFRELTAEVQAFIDDRPARKARLQEAWTQLNVLHLATLSVERDAGACAHKAGQAFLAYTSAIAIYVTLENVPTEAVHAALKAGNTTPLRGAP